MGIVLYARIDNSVFACVVWFLRVKNNAQRSGMNKMKRIALIMALVLAASAAAAFAADPQGVLAAASACCDLAAGCCGKGASCC